MKYIKIKMTDNLGIQAGLPVKLLIDYLIEAVKDHPNAIVTKIEQKADVNSFSDTLSIVVDHK